jgi:gamma-glutamyl:cysteine ligase YbdK (ATP-grasp superfamily)
MLKQLRTMDNQKRIRAARMAIEAHLVTTKDDTRTHDEDIIDLLTNLMHLAQADGFDPASLVRMASANYEAESNPNKKK